jgi:hypothetical protein
MSFWEERWERRRREAEQAARGPADDRAQAAAAELLRLEAELADLELSTLSSPPRPFEPVGIIHGATCDDPAKALIRLKEQARASECDAVYGVGICPVVTGAVAAGVGTLLPQYFAYGTGVRWVPAQEATGTPATAG